MKEKPMQPVTRESIEAAKQQQAADREMVFQKTGMRITDDGQPAREKKS